MLEYLNFCMIFVMFCGGGYLGIKLYSYKKAMDELLCVAGGDNKSGEKRDRLVVCVVGGNSKEYLGKHYTREQIDKLTEEEVEKLYMQYEAKLSHHMSKSLGKTIINLYSTFASSIFGIDSSPLGKDLGDDPFLNSALQRFTCELYYRYGCWIAPLSVGVITGKHYLEKSINIKNDGDTTRTSTGDKEREESQESGGGEEVS